MRWSHAPRRMPPAQRDGFRRQERERHVRIADSLVDGRSWFTPGAFFRIPTGEPKTGIEKAYPGVITAGRDICCFDSHPRRLSPTDPAEPPRTRNSRRLSAEAISPSSAGVSARQAPNSLVGTREVLSK